jgi:hypothetical protein
MKMRVAPLLTVGAMDFFMQVADIAPLPMARLPHDYMHNLLSKIEIMRLAAAQGEKI